MRGKKEQVPEPAPQQINDALAIDAELEGNAADDNVRENSDSILQPSLETTAKKEKDWSQRRCRYK